MSEDQTLAGGPTQKATPRPAPSPFERPEPTSIDLESSRQLTVAEILTMARLPERRAGICLRADLQARYDAIIEELGTLLDANGELVVDPESTIGEQTAEARARDLSDQLEGVRREMAGSMWWPLFRGLSADDLAVFEKEHLPSGQGADLTDYHNRLISKTCVDPAMSPDEVQQLRQTIGFKAFFSLVTTAREVCYGGGVDVPKSLNFSPAPTGN